MSDRRLAIEILNRGNLIGALLAPPHVAKRPVELGATSEMCVPAEGVGASHLVFLVQGERLLVSAIDGGPPAFTEAGPIPPAWTEIRLPTRIRLGETTLHVFWCLALLAEESHEVVRASPPKLVVVRKRTPASGTASVRRIDTPLPRPSPPPRRLPDAAIAENKNVRVGPLPPPRPPTRDPRISETAIHIAPSVPIVDLPSFPIQTPPRSRGPRLAATPPPLEAPAPRRPSSPTIVTDLEQRAGVRPKTSEAERPATTVLSRITTAWKRVEALLGPPRPTAGTPRSPVS